MQDEKFLYTSNLNIQYTHLDHIGLVSHAADL